uniref:Col_cuticle_N domain-containing protein n=1 Tax=Ascaris lumbricoides TaxID=6252 RepID=A0A0M3IT54_ASCLU
MLCRFTRVENAATVEENNACIHLSFNTLAAAICLITSIFLLSALLVICIHPIAYKTAHLSENYSAFQMGSEEYICLPHDDAEICKRLICDHMDRYTRGTHMMWQH